MTTLRNVRLGEFEFDLETGDLSTLGSVAPPQRLAPQPAKLLSLLVAKKGGLLSRDEIRQAIWPNVEVDFDQSLNFCIRQVRNALGDSAEAPRYIETLPRRGYRLVVEPMNGSPPANPRRSRTAWAAWAAVAVVALGLIWLALGLLPGDGASIRLAIMPFQPPPEMKFANPPSEISDRLLDSFGQLGVERLAVIGPATTRAYSSDLRSVSRLADELEIDFVINGRFFSSEDGNELLAELIRSSDGAHLWVQRFPANSPWPSVAAEIERAIRQRLDLAPRE